MSKLQRVNASELARRSDYSPATVSTWTRAGILKRKAGLYDLVESLEAIKRHESERGSDGSHERGPLTDLKRKFLEKKIEKLTYEIAVATGTVHPKAACAQSMMAMLAAESRVLWTLPRSFKGAFPEISPQQTKWLDDQVRSILARLKDGRAYDVTFTCPHCHKRIEKLDAEPTEASPI